MEGITNTFLIPAEAMTNFTEGIKLLGTGAMITASAFVTYLLAKFSRWIMTKILKKDV